MTSTTTLPSYNGWPNYPTWNVALWMGNDEGSDAYARELTRQAIRENSEDIYSETDDDADPTVEVDRDGAVADLAEALKDWHEEASPDLEGFTADIYGWAMGFVDWRHIAEHQVDDMISEDD